MHVRIVYIHISKIQLKLGFMNVHHTRNQLMQFEPNSMFLGQRNSEIMYIWCSMVLHAEMDAHVSYTTLETNIYMYIIEVQGKVYVVHFLGISHR